MCGADCCFVSSSVSVCESGRVILSREKELVPGLLSRETRVLHSKRNEMGINQRRGEKVEEEAVDMTSRVTTGTTGDANHRTEKTRHTG